jgi:hypothetical protein
MAKTLDEFKKEWLQVKKLLGDADEELKSAKESRGMADGIIEQGCREIGRRVRVLRSEGTPGTTIEDFKGDKEVKLMLKGISEHMAALDRNINNIKSQCAGPFDKVVKRYDALDKGLTAEIAARKKELSSKLKTGNKSLPDMQKLLVEVGTLKQMRKFVGNYEEKMMPKIETYEGHYKDWLTEEINLSKDAGWSRDQAEHYDRLLVDRRLSTNFNTAKTLYTRIGFLAKAGKAAKARNDTTGAASTRQNLGVTVLELEKLVSDYISACDAIGLDALKNAKNYAKIDQAVTGMKQMLKVGEEALRDY